MLFVLRPVKTRVRSSGNYIAIDLSPGKLWMWGIDNYGYLGDNTSATFGKSSPIQTIAGGSTWKNVDCSPSHTAAIKSDGTLWTWGRNDFGQLGNGSVTRTSSPAQTVAGGTNWKQASSGTDHVAAIKTDGTLWIWGNNLYGQLGDGTITNKSSPIQTIMGGTDWSQVSCGVDYTAAIKKDGSLWCWGINVGNIGDNTITHRSSPVQTVAGGNKWVYVDCGEQYTGALKNDGTLWMWGTNTHGSLGINSVTNTSSPVQTVAGGNDWSYVSCGLGHTGAIKTDGTLWMWGRDQYGQLGIASITKKSSPVQTVAGGNNWKSVSCGWYGTGAIKTDGTLWVWGHGNYGEMGNRTILSTSSPVQTIMGGNNWTTISAGNFMGAISTA